MSAIRCHFDGKVIVPDEPVDLPVGQPIYVRVEDGSGRSGVVFIDPPDRKPMTVGEMLASGGNSRTPRNGFHTRAPFGLNRQSAFAH